MGKNSKAQPTAMPSPDTPFKFTGVMACAACHSGPMFNFQFSTWRMSRHAQAYATLATAKALEIAKESGVTGDPQKREECLKCHTTGNGFAAASFLKGFDRRDGVQCEACHGPGSDYSPEAVMRDKAAALVSRLARPTAKSACHATKKLTGSNSIMTWL